MVSTPCGHLPNKRQQKETPSLSNFANALNTADRNLGLRLRWEKCHLYETPNTINACQSTQYPSFSEVITVHENINIEWLKPTIGSIEYVSQWLRKKLLQHQKITQTVCAMEYKHEASTLLRS